MTPPSERRRPSYQYQPRTPLHTPSPTTTIGAIIASRRSQNGVVSYNKCRPANKTTSFVVPLDNNSSFSIPSPNRIFKSILHSLSRPSPKPSPEDDDRWKVAAAELSRKVVEATMKRDEAIIEASELRYSIVELEKKLNRLEVYCLSLNTGFQVCNSGGGGGGGGIVKGHDRIIDEFLVAVAGARIAVRSSSRSLTVQIRLTGVKVFDRISSLLQPHDIKISVSGNPKTLIFCLEALLSSSLFEDFESPGFTKNSANRVLNPLDRCEAQYAAFSALKDLTWEEVLSKGTKHFNEDFSRFCDRKMGEIMGLFGLNRAWPEPLLQAFFGASKSVWLVHLLANSVHPGLTVFRVENGSRFDPVYMEDMGEDRAARRLVPTVVRIMVAPGFYVYDNVIKCKVLCNYSGGGGNGVASY